MRVQFLSFLLSWLLLPLTLLCLFLHKRKKDLVRESAPEKRPAALACSEEDKDGVRISTKELDQLLNSDISSENIL